MSRKIIQIAVAGTVENSATQSELSIFALADDGTLWHTDNREISKASVWQSGVWRQLPCLPDCDAQEEGPQ